MTQFKVDFNDFKRRDNTNLMEITLYNDSGEQITPNRDHQWSGKALKFGDGDKRLGQELAVTLDGDKIGVPSKQFENLPSGDYGLELWEVNNDNKTIYPSAGFIEFHIHRNADESLESVTPTTDLNKVIDDLHQAGLNVVVDDIEMLAPDAKPSVTSEIRDGKNHIKLHVPRGLKGDKGDRGPQGPQGDPGPQGPTGSVDNTALTNAPAFVDLQTQVADIKANGAGVNLAQNTRSTATVFDSSAIMPGVNRIVGVGTWRPDGNMKANTAYTAQVTLNFDNVTGSNPTINYQVTDGEWSQNHSFQSSTQPIPTGVTKSVTYAFTFNMAVPISNQFDLRIRFDNLTGGTVSYQKVMLEEGSVAHPWSPNPSEILTQANYANAPAFQALQTQVNDSAVGTNLLIGTSPSEHSYVGDFSTTPDWSSDLGVVNKYAVNAGNTYTYSINLTKLTGSFVLGVWTYDGNKNYVSWVSSGGHSSTGKVSWTFTVPSGVSYVYPHVVHYNGDFTCTAKEEKLEVGSVATPWSLNPSEILTQTDYAKIQAAIVALGGSL